MRRFRFVIWLMAMLAAAAMPAVSIAQIISITIAPPVLPVYVQPPIPAPGYIWAPGYWHYGPLGYYWVPGTWVLPPAIGLLWTPGYWGWQGGVYAWSGGYWGPHIGFYGGVNYGFGYGGAGYEGGYWNNGAFSYNRTVNNFGNVNITNVYNKTVINNNTNVTNTSFNGGKGGTKVKPTPQEQTAAREQHVAATKEQAQHQQGASTNKALLASENHGRPAIAATSKPGEFTGEGVVAAGKPGTTPRGTSLPTTKLAPVGVHPKAPGAGEGNATPNGGTPPKSLNTPPAHKPVAAAPPPHVAAPARPLPHVAAPARPLPHVAAPARPQPHVAAPRRPPPHVAAPARPPAKPAPQAHPAPNRNPPG